MLDFVAGQGRWTGTTKKNGTGLGLASVYRIIGNHKGIIKVQSKESLGFSITLQLPFSI